MKETRLLMGMPITVEIVDTVYKDLIGEVFSYFEDIDATFSTYKQDSEISRFNRGEIRKEALGDDVKTVLELSHQTKLETHGYFDITKDGKIDPSGLVKGWAIWQAAKMLEQKGVKNFFVDAGGDMQVAGRNAQGKIWQIGIKNPFDQSKIVKVLELENRGVATSGSYIRGTHVYDPVGHEALEEIVSLTVVGPNVYEADRFATAAFAMGRNGITFIGKQKDLEGYQIDKNGEATYTSGFEKYVV